MKPARKEPDTSTSGSNDSGISNEQEPDVVFRVGLGEADRPVENLEQFYREALQDLLEIVRLSFRGERVLVDGFAFRNRPERVIPIVCDEDRGPK
jgi:hypothetical protein